LRRFKRISRSIQAGCCRLLVPSLLLLSFAVCAAAQAQTSRYVYDDDGRLRAVIAPNGEAAVYEYDAVGNFTAVRRLSADSLEVLSFSPHSGVAGTRVVFYGVGFAPGVSSVAFFGGAVGTLVGFTNNTITAIVPEGAETGPITINTARGMLTTADPFVVQGIVVSPAGATVFGEESIQFSATAILPGDDQQVAWSVNGIEGGNDSVGRITSEGLYTAPPDPPVTFQVSVQAASVAFPAIAGAVSVYIRSLSDFRFTLSQGVSIGKGEGFVNASAFSQGVSIGKGERYTFGAAFSPGVSVGKGEGITNAAAFSPGVALTKGPIISSVSPSSVVQGSNVNLTLGGVNFGGATGVRLFNLDGTSASGIAVSNINVVGSSLNVTLTVQAGASIGPKIIVVTTPTGHSVTSDIGVNIIQITVP
jgi:YD repeat-containing protein